MPGVLVGDRCLRVVPAVSDGILLRVLAALLEAVDAHVDKHLAEDVGRALGDHEAAVLGVGVGVPCAHDDTGVGCLLEGVGDAVRVDRGDAQGVDARRDLLVDDGDLGRDGGRGVAHVVNREAPLLGVLLGAVVGGLEERVAGHLGDERDGLAGDVSAGAGGAAAGRGVRGAGVGRAGPAAATDEAEADGGHGDTHEPAEVPTREL